MCGRLQQRCLASRASRPSWTSRSQLSSTAPRSRSHRFQSLLAAPRQSNAPRSPTAHAAAIVPRALHIASAPKAPRHDSQPMSSRTRRPQPTRTLPQPITGLRPRDHHHPKWTDRVGSRCRQLSSIYRVRPCQSSSFVVTCLDCVTYLRLLPSLLLPCHPSPLGHYPHSSTHPNGVLLFLAAPSALSPPPPPPSRERVRYSPYDRQDSVQHRQQQYTQARQHPTTHPRFFRPPLTSSK